MARLQKHCDRSLTAAYIVCCLSKESQALPWPGRHDLGMLQDARFIRKAGPGSCLGRDRRARNAKWVVDPLTVLSGR